MKKERRITNTSRNCRLVSVYLTLSVNRQYTSKTTLVDFHHPHSDIDVDFIIPTRVLCDQHHSRTRNRNLPVIVLSMSQSKNRKQTPKTKHIYHNHSMVSNLRCGITPKDARHNKPHKSSIKSHKRKERKSTKSHLVPTEVSLSPH